MSDEEKKAIEYLKTRLYGNEGCEFIDVAQSDLRIFLNLAEKQQKEIERLEARKYMLNAITGEVTEIPLDNNYIRKDKIKAKIEEVDYKMIAHQDVREALKQVLNSLLEKG